MVVYSHLHLINISRYARIGVDTRRYARIGADRRRYTRIGADQRVLGLAYTRRSARIVNAALLAKQLTLASWLLIKNFPKNHC